MGVHAHSVTGKLDPAIVWERWTDPGHWSNDDPRIARAALNGPVAKGAGGIVRPKKGLPWAFHIAEEDRQQMRFTIESKLPLAVLALEYELTRPDESADPDIRELTHRVTITGPLARLWDRLFGRTIARGLPTVLDNIVAAASV